MKPINVIVVHRKGRKFLYLRYECPVTGERYEKSSGTASEKEARKRAGEWQSELLAGGGQKQSSKWADFRTQYEEGKVFGLRGRTAEKISAMFNVVESTMKPDNVRRINPQWLTELQKRLLAGGRSPATVESICRHLKAALNWARSQGIISQVPKFPKLNKVRAAKQMKGRPVSAEEFDRLLLAVDAVWKDKASQDSFKFLLNGLWLSGLRLGEALSLTWDQWADGIRVDMSGKYVKLLIPAESEKGGQDRVYPVTPDFAELLRSIPAAQRSGFVFNPMLSKRVCRRTDTVSKAIISIGEKAMIKVDEKPSAEKGEPPIPVWASAHDLRRGFGFRWSRKVSPMVLKELMRHASVSTTEKFYVGINADATAGFLAELSEKQVAEVTLQVTPDPK